MYRPKGEGLQVRNLLAQSQLDRMRSGAPSPLPRRDHELHRSRVWVTGRCKPPESELILESMGGMGMFSKHVGSGTGARRRLGITWAASLLAIASILTGAADVGAATIDFNSLAHGEVVTTQFVGSNGVTISAVNPNRSHDLAIAFGSLETGTSDPDLEGPTWAKGNLAPDTVLDKLLIIAEKSAQSTPGIVNDPDDEGHRPAGELILEFSSAMTAFGLDLVDVESVSAENGALTFFLGGAEVGEVTFDMFTDSLSAYYDPSVGYGNNSANRIAPITALDLSATGFDKVVVSMGGSGAIDNLNFVPEPGSALLLAAGLGAGLLRRRRHT